MIPISSNSSLNPQQLIDNMVFTVKAHAFHSQKQEDAFRFWDEKTPYAIHPLWCAMTLLTETALPEGLREVGYQVLLWHDILEDTDMKLPEDVSPRVKTLVEEMTFSSFDQERVLLWRRSDEAKLLKLYDKVSNLLDGVWMSDRLRTKYLTHTKKLITFVQAKYGKLNIVSIAQSICSPQE